MSETTRKSDPPARRRLLQWCAVLFGTLATAAMGIPIIGYLLSMVFRKPQDQWVSLGPVSQFPEKQTRLHNFDLYPPKKSESESDQPPAWEGATRKASAYVRNKGNNEFEVFAVNCAHLGCPVTWFPQSGLFMCPCHGGVYYEDGAHASGPPPRGLYKYAIKIEDGVLKINADHLPTLQNPLRRDDDGGHA